jgi:hypothetical protein
MSRYIIATSLHYIGGVDQFDVFVSPERGLYVIKWAIHLRGQTLSKRAIQNPQHLQHYCRDSGMTADQALRISLLVKLFGPKEKQ